MKNGTTSACKAFGIPYAAAEFDEAGPGVVLEDPEDPDASLLALTAGAGVPDPPLGAALAPEALSVDGEAEAGVAAAALAPPDELERESLI